MVSRRNLMKTAAAGSSSLLAPAVVSANNDTGEENLDKGRSTIVTVDLSIDDYPDRCLEVSREPKEFAFTQSNKNRLFVSEANSHPEFELGTDILIANENKRLVSKKVGEVYSIAEKPRTLRSNQGDIVGNIQAKINLHLRNSNENSTNRGVPQMEVGLNTETISINIEPNETETIEQKCPVQYMTKERNKETFEATLRATIENHGSRQIIAHPDRRVLPNSHRLAPQARQLLEKQGGASGVRLRNTIVKIGHSAKYGVYTINQQFSPRKGGDS